jgi:hypothetical protein
LHKKLEDLMTAASFAEAGEPDTAREMLGSRKKVLLVLTGRQSDAKSFKYALNMAKRNNADIEVLMTGASKAAEQTLNLFARQMQSEAVGLTISRKSGCVKESIINHTKKRSDILCVVVESAELLDINCSHKHKKLERVWRELSCPLALVSERGRA